MRGPSFDDLRSSWITEFGIGVVDLDGAPTKPGSRTFGARLNIGEQARHGVSLNYPHVCNAGLKKPNPGEDFIQLRRAYRF